MTKRARIIPADAPAALVIGDKVRVFDPTNPVHLNWLEIMLEGMRNKLGAAALYPPAFDEVITQEGLRQWDKEVRDQNGIGGTRAWRAVFTAFCELAGRSKVWNPTLIHPTEIEARVIPLGLFVLKSNRWDLVRAGDKTAGVGSADFVVTYLNTRGLRLGMDTRAWLKVRKTLLA